MQITITLNFEDATLKAYSEHKGNSTQPEYAQEPMEYIKAYWRGQIMSDINTFLDTQARIQLENQIAEATALAKADAESKITIE